MKFNKVTAVWFSPTGNTRKVVQTVADTLAAALQLPRADVDLTLPAGRGEAHSFGPEDLVVFGTPTYAGASPTRCSPRLPPSSTARVPPPWPLRCMATAASRTPCPS